MPTFKIFGQLQRTDQVPLWLIILDFLDTLLWVGLVFSNYPEIRSFQDASNRICRIQLFLRSIYKALVWHTAESLSLRVFYATVITPYWTFFLFLLKYLELVSTYECFLASDLLDNLIWSGKTCVLAVENDAMNSMQPQEWLGNL